MDIVKTTGLFTIQLTDRDSQTLSRLLERLAKWKVTVYYTDDWRPYQQLLDEHPDAFHGISKRETVGIERNNSDGRHWFARFHRRTKVVSRSAYMVDITMAIFAKFRVSGNIEPLHNWRFSLLS
ncbi:IS1 family transposase [Synechocystis sp. B12]|nr:IS1 family transposase [Synechocystis sp. B12]